MFHLTLSDGMQRSRGVMFPESIPHIPSIYPYCRGSAAQTAESSVTTIFSKEIPTTHFSVDTELNEELLKLHKRLFLGDNGVQREIDSYIFAELIFRDPERAKRLSGGQKGLHKRLNTGMIGTVHVDKLPDLGEYIRVIIFFSGDAPPETQLPNTLIHSLVHEALPCIKRTKQIKSRTWGDEMPRPATAACVSILLGTLLGLYPSSSKQPLFQERCDIVAAMHTLQCYPDTKKQQFMDKIPHVLRICFMEYVPWFVHTYMPIESEIIKKCNTTDVYFKTYVNTCDSFRQQLQSIKTPEDLFKHENIAAQCIERCTRTCKFKMHRHLFFKDTHIACTEEVDSETFSKALELHQFVNHHRCYKKGYGRGVVSKDMSHDLRIFSEGASELTIKCASSLHQALQIHRLPVNIARQQEEAIIQKFPNCNMQFMQCRFLYLCGTCIFQGRNNKKQKFRLSLLDGSLQCNTCKKGFSVLRVDLLGTVVYYMGQALFLCPFCLKCAPYDASGGCFTGVCSKCPLTQKADAKVGKKVCVRCQNTNINTTITLLNAQTMCMEAVDLCSEHTPSVGLMKFITEITQIP
eukprot:2267694-Rhodomonas_salina.2